MANAVNKRFGWFRYTANSGAFWSVRTDKTWGANAASGLAAHNPADPVWPSSGRYRVRRVLLNDPISGITTKRVLGTTAAAAGVEGAVVTGYVVGSAGLNTFNSLGYVPERTPKHKSIISPPVSITA